MALQREISRHQVPPKVVILPRKKKINLNLVKTLDPITGLQNHQGQRNILNDMTET